MGYPQKIVTCCYCGTRAALVLTGKSRHELACSNCGAPLHDLKMLPRERTGDRELIDHPAKRPQHFAKVEKPRKSKYKKKKSRKGFRLFKKLAEEAFDIVEDIFD